MASGTMSVRCTTTLSSHQTTTLSRRPTNAHWERLNLSENSWRNIVDLPYLMGRAYTVALQSPDPSNQNGALLIDSHEGGILSEGHNGFGKIPFSWNDLTDRDKKLAFIEHAERACLFECAKNYQTDGSIMVCPWACCTDCGRAIARCGVEKVIVHGARMATTPDRWKKSVEDGLSCLTHYGVELEYYEGPIELPTDFTIKANGKDWSPHVLTSSDEAR